MGKRSKGRARGLNLDLVADVQRELVDREPPTITFKGETFTLDEDLPLEALEVQADLTDALQRIEEIERDRGKDAANVEASKLGRLYIRLGAAIMGDEWERFRKLKPGLNVLAELSASIPELYPSVFGEVGEAGEGEASGD